MDDRAVVERQLGRPPRAFSRVAVRCPFGRPAVTEQAPYDAAGQSVSDDVLADVPASRRGGVAARGSRRSRAVERARRGTTATWRRACATANAEQRRLRPELPVGIGGTHAKRQPQVPARARAHSRSRVPGTTSATGSSPRFRRCGPASSAAVASVRRRVHPDRTHRLGARLRRARGPEERPPPVRAPARRRRRGDGRVARPNRADVHARATRRRHTQTSIAGDASRSPSAHPTTGGRAISRSSRTLPSTCMRAARSTSSREHEQRTRPPCAPPEPQNLRRVARGRRVRHRRRPRPGAP